MTTQLRISNAARTLTPSALRAEWPLFKAAARGDGTDVPFASIEFGVACLDFPPSPELIELLKFGKAEKYTTPATGDSALRRAVAEDLAVNTGVGFTADDVLITAGGLGGARDALGLFCNPGDTVVAVTPCWPNTLKEYNMRGANLVQLFCPSGHLPPPEELLGQVPEDARMFLMNEPSNPLGVAASNVDVESLRALLEARPEIVVILDMEYWGLNVGEVHTGLSVNHPRIVGHGSFSKTLNIPNARLGWFIVHPASGVQPTILKWADEGLSQNNLGGLQAAIAEFMTSGGAEEYYGKVVEFVESNRNACEGALQGSPLRFHRGDAAFFSTIELPEGVDASALRRWQLLMRWRGVIRDPFPDLVPAFYMQGRRFRLSHAPLVPDAVRGLDALVRDTVAYQSLDCPRAPTTAELLSMFGPGGTELPRRSVAAK